MKTIFLSHRLKWLLVSLIFLSTHLFTAYQGYAYLNSGVIGGLHLDASAKDWAKATIPGDCGIYLRVATNVAEGRGLIDISGSENAPIYVPFTFWAPGTPWIFGQYLKLTHSTTALSIYIFAMLSQIISGAILIATLALFTQNLAPLILASFFSGWVPPLQTFIYSAYVSSSEVATMIPQALFFFFLAKSFIALWSKSIRSKTVIFYFGITGLTLGICSIIRDSYFQFAEFLAIAIVALVILRKGRIGISRALVASSSLLFCAWIVRVPVLLWNLQREGVKTAYVSGSAGNIWRYGVWEKHNLVDWQYTSGIGWGDYLSPETGIKMREAFDRGQLTASLGLKELAKAISRKPADALLFKVKRWPVLWLGTVEWPHSQMTLVSVYCAAFYFLFLFYLGMCWKNKTWPLEITYLYALFLFIVSFIIHQEFRYTYPVWATLSIVPSLLILEITKLWKLREIKNC